MRHKHRILVVEDDRNVVDFLVDGLKHIGFQVEIAVDGAEALQKVKRKKFDLVVLDVELPKVDGFEVCRQIRADPALYKIPILMLTARVHVPDRVRGLDIGADDYLTKPYASTEFHARVKALIRRSHSSPYDTSRKGIDAYISCIPGTPIGLHANGEVSINILSENPLQLNVEAWTQEARIVPLTNWRLTTKQRGKQLYQKIIVRHPEVFRGFSQLQTDVMNESDLRLRFVSSRDFLGVPMEFLFEGVQEEDNQEVGDYLVLKHPFARSVMGVRMRALPLTPNFLNGLWTDGEDLRVLLIASNTFPSIPHVDEEVRMLAHLIKRSFSSKGLSVSVTTIPTGRASIETVKSALHKCDYHVVHYAGHGVYDKASPEDSYLAFWEKQKRKGRVKELRVPELKMLLTDSKVQFIYLSCCEGTETGGKDKLVNDDFLGVADGLIHAGIPSVLSYRWPVSDRGAKILAQAFYSSLADDGHIETALLRARQEVAAQDRNSLTWLSPMLIKQS